MTDLLGDMMRLLDGFVCEDDSKLLNPIKCEKSLEVTVVDRLGNPLENSITDPMPLVVTAKAITVTPM